jgi:hypothetical protein
MKYKIIKQKSSEPDTTTDTSTSTTDSFTQTSKQDRPKEFINIEQTNYTRPKKTAQDNYTKDEINEKLLGYVSLKTSSHKKFLLTLQPFKVWIKYYNPITKKFRTGGLLMKVDPELRYITLGNPGNKITWSVQLKDHIIFVPNPKKQEEKIQQQKELEKEDRTKEKLLDLYKQGKLQKK